MSQPVALLTCADGVIGQNIPLLDRSWKKTWAMNVTTSLRISQAVDVRMIPEDLPGRIVHIASINDVIAAPNQATYAATKARHYTS